MYLVYNKTVYNLSRVAFFSVDKKTILMNYDLQAFPVKMKFDDESIAERVFETIINNLHSNAKILKIDETGTLM